MVVIFLFKGHITSMNSVGHKAVTLTLYNLLSLFKPIQLWSFVVMLLHAVASCLGMKKKLFLFLKIVHFVLNVHV